MPLAFLLALAFDAPVLWIWLVNLFDHVARAVWLAVSFRRGRWATQRRGSWIGTRTLGGNHMVELPLVGGCQCGGLRYAISEPPLMVYNCHCTNCQKIGGGAFSTPVTVLETSFRFTKGEPRTYEWTSDAGNRRYGWFCGNCGSRIAHGQIGSAGILSVRGGTLDDTSWIEPVGDIWTRSAQPWVAHAGECIRTDQQPADYVPFIERFRAQGRFAG